MNIDEIKNQHPSVFEEVVTNNQYRVNLPDIEGKNIIDVGANNGVFSLLAVNYGARKIVAIEANPNVFSILQENTKDLPNVSVLNKAVHAESGLRVKVNIEPYFSAIDGRCFVTPDETGNIETISLNDILPMVDDSDIVLKMDCEGSEYEILYALNDFTKVSTILLEAHQNMGAAPTGDDNVKKLVHYITSKGFRISFINCFMEGNVQIIRFDRNIICNDITVLINGFNRPEYLKDQIAALNAQTIRPDKILVLFTKPKKDFPVPFIDGIDFIVVENDQGLNTRFAVGLIARTKFICILDDDIMPGKKWLESCLDIIREEDVVISSYGIKFTDSWSDLTGLKYGDHGIHSNVSTEIDMAGHSWFMKKEWLKFFWMEEPLDWTVSDDIHLSYTMRKYGKLKLVVSSYPEDNPDVWGNTMPERGLGKKSLHARKVEDKEVWQDPDKPNGWTTPEEIAYLSSNFNAFVEKRRILLQQYQSRS